MNLNIRLVRQWLILTIAVQGLDYVNQTFGTDFDNIDDCYRQVNNVIKCLNAYIVSHETA